MLSGWIVRSGCLTNMVVQDDDDYQWARLLLYMYIEEMLYGFENQTTTNINWLYT